MKLKYIIIAILAVSLHQSAAAVRHMPSAGHSAEIWLQKGHAPAVQDNDTLDLSECDFQAVFKRCYDCSDDSSFYVIERGESAQYIWHGDSLLLASQGAPGKIFRAVIPTVATISGNNSTLQGFCHYEGRIGSATNMRRYGIWTLHRPESRTVITPDADTIPDCHMLSREEIGVLDMSEAPLDTLRMTASQMFSHDVCSDSVGYALRVDSYFVQSAPYPLVEREVYRLLYYGTCIDSIHITRFCPPGIAEPSVVNPLYRNERVRTSASAGTPPLAVTGYEVKPTIFNDRISVTATGDMQTATSLAITDISGRMVLTVPLHDWHTVIDATDFTPGAYVLTITNGESSVSYKLLKP